MDVYAVYVYYFYICIYIYMYIYVYTYVCKCSLDIIYSVHKYTIVYIQLRTPKHTNIVRS